MWAYISENVEKVFITPSSSSTGSPVLFVQKKLGGLCLCVHYRKFNAVTRKNRYPVPPMNQLLTIFNSSTIFSNIDLRGAYHLLRIKEGEERLTAFRTKYGRLATLPDAFSRWDNVYPEMGVDFIRKNPHNFHQVIKEDGIPNSIFFSIKVELFSDLVDKIKKEVWKDNDYKEILKQLARGESVPDHSLEPQAKLLLFKDRVVIPRNEEIQLNILQKHHDSALAGPPGQEKTLKLIKRDFNWAGMNQFSKDSVSSCQQCLRNKNIHHTTVKQL
ncbi:hypothetical protein O181_067337 [Austropuccinia psidii MF-1]|uniref:Integrase zinc-binding domain-containing protein n=1 Tax=Austropuccinia psidii MF-1 TaxID=1389203 RepID=A0A9Q3I560_9BASI|nr:hypothetical protein [Austropuccinia psidii MF-1]